MKSGVWYDIMNTWKARTILPDTQQTLAKIMDIYVANLFGACQYMCSWTTTMSVTCLQVGHSKKVRGYMVMPVKFDKDRASFRESLGQQMFFNGDILGLCQLWNDNYIYMIILLLNCIHDVRTFEFMNGVCTGLAGSGYCQSTAHIFIVYKSIPMILVE